MKGTTNCLQIVKHYPGQTAGQATFDANLRDGEKSLSNTWALTTVDGKQFLMTGNQKHLTAREICQELLDVLCAASAGSQRKKQ